jgi:hypothetical protein
VSAVAVVPSTALGSVRKVVPESTTRPVLVPESAALSKASAAPPTLRLANPTWRKSQITGSKSGARSTQTYCHANHGVILCNIMH